MIHTRRSDISIICFLVLISIFEFLFHMSIEAYFLSQAGSMRNNLIWKTGRRLVQFPLTFDGTSFPLKHISKAFCNQQYWLSLNFLQTYYFAWLGQKQKRSLFMKLEHKSVVFYTYINDLRVHANETW